MFTNLARLLGVMLLIGPAAYGQSRDQQMNDANHAFEAAVSMWDRSPSPLIDKLLRRALALQEAAVGVRDPAVARTRNRIGRNAYNGGDFRLAEQMFRDAVRIAAPQVTDLDVEFSRYLGDLGAALREQQRYSEAWPPVCRSLAIRRAALPAHDPLIAASLDNLGRIALAEKRLSEARSLFDESYRINLAAYGSGAPYVQQQAQLLIELRRAAPGEVAQLDPCHTPAIS